MSWVSDAIDVPRETSGILVPKILGFLGSDRDSSPPRATGYHASAMFDFCPRETALVHRHFKVVPGKEEFSSTTLFTFKRGSVTHGILQNGVLAKMGVLVGWWCKLNTEERVEGVCPQDGGVWEYEEPSFRVSIDGTPDGPQWDLVGACDGILVLDGQTVGLEAKSCKTSIYRGLPKAFEDMRLIRDWYAAGGGSSKWHDKYARGHTFQLQIYLNALGIEDGVVLYLPKEPTQDDPPLLEFAVKRDPGVMDVAKKKIRLVAEAENGGDWRGPVPEGICRTPGCLRAQKCPVVNQCFSGDLA